MDETTSWKRVAESEDIRGPVLAFAEATGVVPGFVVNEQWCFPEPPIWSERLNQMICPLSYWPAHGAPSYWRSLPCPPKFADNNSANATRSLRRLFRFS